MLDALPFRAFFRFEVPLYYQAGASRIDADLRKWDPRCLLPPLVEIDGAEPFADVYAAWNDDGLHLAFDVPNRHGPLRCDPTHWWKGDGVRICIDTRDTRELKRATRFCHFFYALPLGGGTDRTQPLVGLHKMSHAKEGPPAVNPKLIKAAARNTRTSYALELAIPAGCLNGWDPAEHARIGLFYKIRDTHHGDQHLTVGDELGWNVDPSTWATAVLTR